MPEPPSRAPRDPSDSTQTWTDVFDLETPLSGPMAPFTQKFLEVIQSRMLCSAVVFDSLERIGSGGEGHVFRSIRHGADGFSVVSAVKVFSPAVYATMEEYESNMRGVSRVASTVTRIQHDHLVDVYNFFKQDRIRFMVMEWINGFDLAALMSCMDESHDEIQSLPDAIVERGGHGAPHLKPGVAVHIVGECLAGLAALHRRHVVHGDVKPSNIMLNGTGSTKLIDIGSTDSIRRQKPGHVLTPRFAAPEILMGAISTPQSDLASLGYTLISLLSGRVPFADVSTRQELIEAKRSLVDNMRSVLPDYVCGCESLVGLCKELVAVNQAERLDTAETAIRRCEEVKHHLVLDSLDCDFQDALRGWMDDWAPSQ